MIIYVYFWNLLLMIVLVILAVIEALTYFVLRQHLFEKRRSLFYFSMLVNTLLSIWLWILASELVNYKGLFDMPGHIWMIMSITGMLFAVILPRLLLILLHFTGRFFRNRYGKVQGWLTTAGIIIYLLACVIMAAGTFSGRFRYVTERYEVTVGGLHPDLEGLRIVLISDLHLASYYHHPHKLAEAVEIINNEEPDLILNTGDFVTFGWREYDRHDTILSASRSRLGNFAVAGNHDFGTYHPYYSEAERANNVLQINRFAEASGYSMLNNENVIVRKDSARIMLAGVITLGRFPDIVHGDVNKALEGSENADLVLLLIHDPNQWDRDVKGRNDVDITFAGHTHGMQIGIITKKFRWSPASHIYPQWNGLYHNNGRSLIVNRGLGVLGIPARIWMPPEISVVTIRGE